MAGFDYDVRRAETPYQTVFDGLALRVRPDVYEPHEDSFLLARAARRYAHGRVLDLGCGTGIVGLSASLDPAVSEIVFADVSPSALELARKNAVQNRLEKPHGFLRTDLFSSLQAETFDTACFNPPYLPTDEGEKLPGLENAAYDGGPDGRKVLDAFLGRFGAHLRPGGSLLLLNSSVSAEDGDSGNNITRSRLRKAGFRVKTVGRRSFFFERLVVLHARP